MFGAAMLPGLTPRQLAVLIAVGVRGGATP
jgi:hypothetical protein